MENQKKIFSTIPLLLILFSAAIAFLALPTDTVLRAEGECATNVNAPGPGQRICIENPITGTTSPKNIKEFIGGVIKGILAIIGAFALFFFIQGGFGLIISGGNPEKIKKAKGALIWSVLGLFVVFGSYLILSSLLTALTTP